MTKNSDIEQSGLRGANATRGLRSTRIAGQRGVRIRDESGTDVIAPEWLVIGATVVGDDDDEGTLIIGGGGGGGGGPGAGGSPAIAMLNNAGRDLLPGDVVVVDEAEDAAVTVTTDAGDTRIAGVVQEPIADGAVGRVLFNGFAAVINAPAGVRGEYAQTSTTETQADSTADREAGSFAVYLTGTDFENFVTDLRTTEQPTPVTSLSIDMPPTIPEDRVLFLALWLDDDATSVDVAGWVLIGSEAGFYYYTRVSVGGDTATATWTGASPAVASVLLLHENVQLALPIEDHDYDDTTSAASLSGLTDAAHYAIAGVDKDVATPGSGFVRLAGGASSFDPGGTLTIVQEAVGEAASGVSFASAVNPGNLLIAVCAARNGGPGGSGNLQMADAAGIVDTSWTDVSVNQHTDTVGNCDYVSLQAKIATSGSAGPFYNTATPTSVVSAIYLFEVSGVGVSGVTALGTTGGAGSPMDLGDFSAVGANDLVVMGLGVKYTGGSTFDPQITHTGFTQDHDDDVFGSPWFWIGHRSGSGGTVAAEVDSALGLGGDWKWGGVAGHFVSASQAAAGTLAGKYIAHDSSVTSPFTGANQNDAIFAVNLLIDAKPSALLYGPDLGGGGGGGSFSGDAVDVDIADSGGYFTATDVEAALQELAAKDIGYQAHGNMGSTETFSAATGWHSGTFDADCTFTFSGATSGLVASMVLELTEDGTGGWEPTWPGSVVWPGGVAPTHDTTAGTTTIYLFQSRDGGTTWYGFQAAGSGGSSVADLDDLTDVTITSPAADQQLQYVGGVWVNNARRWEPLSDNPGGGPEIVFDGDDIVFEWETY